MSITTVLFDLDGTLVDSLADLTDAVNHVRTSYTLPHLTIADVREMVGKGANNLIQQVLPSSSEQERECALQLYINFNTEHIVDKSTFYPGVVLMINQLHAVGVKMAVISNKHESLSRLILNSLGVHDLFAHISGGDTFSEKKPSPLPLLSVMGLLGSTPEQSCMVGDSINDIEAGNTAGITTIGCRWGYGSEKELQNATHQADSVHELHTILESLSTSGSRGTC
jgi:phosphoglycolate phosphatase